MARATILVPTHAERPGLALTLQSALAQSVDDIEVFVVGDGCPDLTREIVSRIAATDARLVFFDFPKGQRHGEASRHEVLKSATGTIVTYLSDDDLLFPDHVEVALVALERGNFMASLPVFVNRDGSVEVLDGDVTSEWWRNTITRTRRNFIPLTGTSHTMELYRALAVPWAPAPADIWTDLHMWRKLMAHTSFVPCVASHPTCLIFTTPVRTNMSPEARAAEQQVWFEKLGDERHRRVVERRVLCERHVSSSANRALFETEQTLAGERNRRLLELEGVTNARMAELQRSEYALAETRLKLEASNSHNRELEAAVAEARVRATRVEHERDVIAQARDAIAHELALLRSSLLWRARDVAYDQPWLREPFLLAKKLLQGVRRRGR